jgi:hypothetical protein
MKEAPVEIKVVKVIHIIVLTEIIQDIVPDEVYG